VRLRARVLQAIFSLLYGPLAFLHELVGQAVFGAAWHGRRIAALGRTESPLLLDVGCGDGRLLVEAMRRGTQAVGVEPSVPQARRGRSRGASIVVATGQRLPVRSGAVGAIVVTYPGPWIGDEQVWNEFARVLQPGGQVVVLLGGTVTHGRGSLLRRVVHRLAYGSTRGDGVAQLPTLGGTAIGGKYDVVDDDWGQVIWWIGRAET
jgi:SAM-dependent methyltransferase